MSSMTSPEKLRASSTTGLPVRWYFDPEYLELERRELFSTGPTYAGHASLVPQNGSYLALEGQLDGQLLVRHNDRCHLVSNVCRHRQAQLLKGSGCAKNIVCPMHNWAYDLDGRQVAAPHFCENPGLDLPRTELAEWNGLLFAGPREINRELAPLASWTELSSEHYVLERVDEEEHDLNWKVFLEVYLEDYHIGVVHPGFRTFVDPCELRGAIQSVGRSRFFCEQVNVRWPMAKAGSPLFAEFQSILVDVLGGKRPPFAAIWLCLFPGQLIEWYPFSMVVTSYVPLSPTRTRLRSEYYFDPEIAASRRDYVESGLAVLDEVTAEDHGAALALQAGRQALFSSGRDDHGPYQMPMEEGLRNFHDCLRSLEGDAARR